MQSKCDDEQRRDVRPKVIRGVSRDSLQARRKRSREKFKISFLVRSLFKFDESNRKSSLVGRFIERYETRLLSDKESLKSIGVIRDSPPTLRRVSRNHP